MATSNGNELMAFKLKLDPKHIIIGCFTINEFYVVVSNTYKYTIFQYYSHSGEEIKSFKIGEMVLCCANCPFNKDVFALTRTNNNIEFWNVQANEPTLVLEGHTKRVSSLVFSPHDGGRTLLSTSDDKTARLWDTSTGECIHVMENSRIMLNSSYAPNGGKVVTCAGNEPAKLWNPHTGKLLGDLTKTKCYYDVQYSPDGKYVATVSVSNELMLIDSNTGKVLKKLSSNKARFEKLTFMKAPGVYVLFATSSDYILLWNLYSNCTHKIENHLIKYIKSLTISPENNLFMVSLVSRVETYFVNAYRLPATMCSDKSFITMILASRRQKLPYIPPELWELMFIEFM